MNESDFEKRLAEAAAKDAAKVRKQGYCAFCDSITEQKTYMMLNKEYADCTVCENTFRYKETKA